MMPKPIQQSFGPALLALAVCSASTLAHPSAAHADPPPPTPSGPPTHKSAAQSSACPTDIPGTAIVATPSSDGAELLFFAPRNVAEMRKRVRALSSLQTRGAVASADKNAPTAAEIAAREPTASVYDVNGGAVLKLTPRNLDQLADVQAHALDYAQRLAGDECVLLRDTPALPADTRKAAAPATMQVPPGIVPGVGGVSSGPMMSIPALGF